MRKMGLDQVDAALSTVADAPAKLAKTLTELLVVETGARLVRLSPFVSGAYRASHGDQPSGLPAKVKGVLPMPTLEKFEEAARRTPPGGTAVLGSDRVYAPRLERPSPISKQAPHGVYGPVVKSIHLDRPALTELAVTRVAKELGT